MTCECVSIEYPSIKLIPLVDTAIKNLEIDLGKTEERIESRRNTHKNKNWLSKIFGSNPDIGYDPYFSNWDDLWLTNRVRRELRVLRTIKLCAENSEIVRISGSDLARVDELAGNC